MPILDKPDALPMRNFYSKPGDYCWEDWERDTKAAHPIRFFIGRTLPNVWHDIATRLRNAYWAIRHRTTNRYHLVKLSNAGGVIEYNVGWIDVNTKLLAFCGKTIVDFIEKEQPCLDEALRGADAAEWKAIYDWWTVERPSAVAASRITLRRGDAREWMAAERVIEERDTEMLIRLIKARGGMWT